MTHIGALDFNDCSKIQIFKNPRWRTVAILKIVNRYTSAPFTDFDEILVG